MLHSNVEKQQVPEGSDELETGVERLASSASRSRPRAGPASGGGRATGGVAPRPAAGLGRSVPGRGRLANASERHGRREGRGLRPVPFYGGVLHAARHLHADGSPPAAGEPPLRKAALAV